MFVNKKGERFIPTSVYLPEAMHKRAQELDICFAEVMREALAKKIKEFEKT